MRRGTGGRCGRTKPDGVRLVDDDGVLGQQRADDGGRDPHRSAAPDGSSGRGTAAAGAVGSGRNAVGQRRQSAAAPSGPASACTSQPSGTRSLGLPG